MASPVQTPVYPPPVNDPYSSLSPDQLIKDYGGTFFNLVRNELEPEVWPDKQYQWAEIRRGNFYYNGKQYLQPVVVQGAIDYKPVDAASLQVSTRVRTQIYDHVLNKFKGLTDKFVAVLGQRSPNVEARPRIPGDEAQIRKSRVADQAASYLRSVWDAEAAQRDLAYSLAVVSTSFFYTPWVSDEHKYGATRVPVLTQTEEPFGKPYYECPSCGAESEAEETAESPAEETAEQAASAPPQAVSHPPSARTSSALEAELEPGPEQGVAASAPTPTPSASCPECGAPLGPENRREPPTTTVIHRTGDESYPNGSVELHMCDGYTVTTPFYLKNVHTCPWLRYEYDEYKGTLLEAYAQSPVIEEIRNMAPSGGGPSFDSGRFSREIAASPSSTGYAGYKHKLLYSRIWIRTSVYQLLTDTALRARLYALFPDGLKMTFIESKLVALENENLCWVWAFSKPGASPYLYAPPVMNTFIQNQDWINNFWNNLKEAADRINALTVYDTNAIHKDVFLKPIPPGGWIPGVPGVNYDQALKRFPGTDLHPELGTLLKMAIDEGQDILGLQPNIWGGQGPTKTAREAELNRNQALAMLNTVWNEMRGGGPDRGWAAAYRNAVMQLARHSGGKLFYPRQSDSEPAQFMEIPGLSELLDGGWYFSAEESIPMTPGQLRDWTMNMIEMGQNAAPLGLGHPSNLAALKGVMPPDWVVPGESERERIIDIIGRLAKEPPLRQPSPDGMSMTETPSIQTDPALFEPQSVAAVVREWLQGDAGRNLEETFNDGFRNVLAWLKQALQAMMPPPQMGPPPGPRAEPNKQQAGGTGGGANAGPQLPPSTLEPPPGIESAPVGAPPPPPPPPPPAELAVPPGR